MTGTDAGMSNIGSIEVTAAGIESWVIVGESKGGVMLVGNESIAGAAVLKATTTSKVLLKKGAIVSVIVTTPSVTVLVIVSVIVIVVVGSPSSSADGAAVTGGEIGIAVCFAPSPSKANKLISASFTSYNTAFKSLVVTSTVSPNDCLFTKSVLLSVLHKYLPSFGKSRTSFSTFPTSKGGVAIRGRT